MICYERVRESQDRWLSRWRADGDVYPAADGQAKPKMQRRKNGWAKTARTMENRSEGQREKNAKRIRTGT